MIGRTPLRPLAALIAALAAPAIAPRAAWAGEPTASELVAARTLFASAERDEDAGRWTEALEKLHKVATVKMTAGVRFHIALCEENLGHLVMALAEYTAAESLAIREKNKEVLESLKGPLAALKARVPELTIDAPADVASVEVSLDGRVIAPGIVGVPMPVELGQHRVEATAPGRVAFATEITVAEGDHTAVEIKLPEAPPPPPPPPPPAPAPRAAPSAPPRAPSPAPQTPQMTGRRPRTAAITATAGAVVLAAGGVGFFLGAGSERESALERCRAQRGACGDDYKSGARVLDALALGAWVGAGAVSVLAAILWTSPRSAPSARVTSPRLVVAPGGIGAAGEF